MRNGGGRSLEGTRELRGDEGLREIFPLVQIPSSDAVGNWLRRMGEGQGLKGVEAANRWFLKRGFMVSRVIR